MASKGGNFISEHIEKIILPIIGIFCLWVLFTRVIITPNSVDYQGRKYAPGQVDEKIAQQAEMLQANLSLPPKPVQEQLEDANQYARYVLAFDDPVGSIDTSYWPEVPLPVNEKVWDGRQYSVPQPPVINEAKAGMIRALAYIPVHELRMGESYEKADVEPNDLDLVTVEAKLQVGQLYESFYENFAGPSVKPQWRDLNLAKPVFAAVQLERSKLEKDGQWGQWEQVPRLKIDGMSSMFKIVEDINALPRGGLKVRMLQFSKPLVMSSLLQPDSYDIASAAEEWFPPSFHEMYINVVKSMEAAERRAEMEKMKKEREQQMASARSARDSRRSSATRTSSDSSGGGGGLSAYTGGGGGGESSSRRNRPVMSRDSRDNKKEELRQKREQERQTITDVYEEFELASITGDTQFSEESDSLLFWAMDDTVEPGSIYRYRIRLGVFNPIAGTQELAADSEEYKDKVIIWSDYADAGTVEVPKRVYFFAKEIQKAADSVQVEVCRYALGNWYNKDYVVEPGEVIGRLDAPQPQGEVAQGVLIPEIVNFSTSAMMVDAVEISDWTEGRNMKPNEHFEMYYSYNGNDIDSAPVSQRNWSSGLLSMYNEIHSSMRVEKEPIRQRSKAVGGRSVESQGDDSGTSSYMEMMRGGK
ncbi:MAG: hypothetical protein WC374_04830 [Phycisphaerae bacterium]|jgi:hypothetical protein